jgi:hypothetical protein
MPTRAPRSLALLLTSALIAAPLVLFPVSLAQADDETSTSTSTESAPVDDAAEGENPAEDAPAEEAPAEETPAEETPAGEEPAGDGSGSDEPVTETPAAEAPADETTAPAPTEKQRNRAAVGPVVTAPTAPLNFRAVSELGYTYFAWDAPSDMGSAPLTNYRLEYADAGSDDWFVFENPTTTRTLTYRWDGLLDFRASVITSAGQSPYASLDGVTQRTQVSPSRPTNVVASASASAIDLSWTAPTYTGTAALTSYTVRYREISAASWSTATVTTNSYRLADLQPNTTYVVQVRSASSVGSSRWTDAQNVTTLGAPSVITDLQATRGDEAVDLEWSAPAANGSAISGYELRYSADGTSTTVDLGDVTSTTITGLENGVEYAFDIRAINEIGAGEWSSVESATPAGAPGSIREFTSSSIADGVTLNWAAPSDNGGSAIVGYEIDYRLAGSTGAYTTVQTTDPTATITNLGNGITYEARARVESEAGFGDWTEQGTFTAGNVPSAPRDVTLRGGDASIAISWTAPAFQGGTTITDYEVTVTDATTDAVISTTTVTGTSTTVTGLTNSTLYEVSVRALNGRIAGPWSTADSIYAFTFDASFTTKDGTTVTTVTPGDTIVVSGSGTLPEAGVFIELHSAPIALGSTTVTEAGTFSVTVTIPKNAPLGKHTLYAGLGMGGGLVADSELAITITAAATAGSGDSLAITGIDPNSLSLALWFALGAAVLGTTLLVTRRRRTSK